MVLRPLAFTLQKMLFIIFMCESARALLFYMYIFVMKSPAGQSACSVGYLTTIIIFIALSALSAVGDF